MAMSPLMTYLPSLRRMGYSKRNGTSMVWCNKSAPSHLSTASVRRQSSTLGNKELGRLVIWEDEEVVDVLYNIRMHHNMTAQDQRISFNDICKRPEVPCNRFKAIAYRKTQITKLDYEKFGNETCRRQFVGVKHLASFGELPFGGKISKMLKKDGVVSVSLLWMLAIVMANVSVVLFTKTLIIPRCVCW